MYRTVTTGHENVSEWSNGTVIFRSDRSDREKRTTSKGGPVFFETFLVGPNRSIEFLTKISGNFGWMDCALENDPQATLCCLSHLGPHWPIFPPRSRAVRGSVSTAKLRGRKLPKTIQLKQNLCVNSAELRSVKTSVSVTTTLKFDLPHWLECSNSFFDSRGSYLQCESRVYFYII